ncbi:unnamed protein product, partial [Symbiodinium sp. CCMP2456]
VGGWFDDDARGPLGQCLEGRSDAGSFDLPVLHPAEIRRRHVGSREALQRLRHI